MNQSGFGSSCSLYLHAAQNFIFLFHFSYLLPAQQSLSCWPGLRYFGIFPSVKMTLSWGTDNHLHHIPRLFCGSWCVGFCTRISCIHVSAWSGVTVLYFFLRMYSVEQDIFQTIIIANQNGRCFWSHHTSATLVLSALITVQHTDKEYITWAK